MSEAKPSVVKESAEEKMDRVVRMCALEKAKWDVCFVRWLDEFLVAGDAKASGAKNVNIEKMGKEICEVPWKAYQECWEKKQKELGIDFLSESKVMNEKEGSLFDEMYGDKVPKK